MCEIRCFSPLNLPPDEVLPLPPDKVPYGPLPHPVVGEELEGVEVVLLADHRLVLRELEKSMSEEVFLKLYFFMLKSLA